MTDKERLERLKCWWDKRGKVYPDDISWLITQAEKNQHYRQIATECLERLSTPGYTGAKGFVYNKLMEVVNDE